MWICGHDSDFEARKYHEWHLILLFLFVVRKNDYQNVFQCPGIKLCLSLRSEHFGAHPSNFFVGIDLAFFYFQIHRDFCLFAMLQTSVLFSKGKSTLVTKQTWMIIFCGCHALRFCKKAEARKEKWPVKSLVYWNCNLSVDILLCQENWDICLVLSLCDILALNAHCDHTVFLLLVYSLILGLNKALASNNETVEISRTDILWVPKRRSTRQFKEFVHLDSHMPNSTPVHSSTVVRFYGWPSCRLLLCTWAISLMLSLHCRNTN